MHGSNETPLELYAFLPRASLAPGIQLGPKFSVIGQKSEFRSVPGLSHAFPIADLGEPIHFLHALKDGLAFHLADFFTAEKIRAALHHRHLQFGRKMLLYKGYILRVKLLLERFRSRRDHHATPAANGRNQIGQRLSCARARLDQQVMLLTKSFLDELRHAQL